MISNEIFFSSDSSKLHIEVLGNYLTLDNSDYINSLLQQCVGRVFPNSEGSFKMKVKYKGKLVYLKQLVYGKKVSPNNFLVFKNGDMSDFSSCNIIQVPKKYYRAFYIDISSDKSTGIWKHRRKGFYTVRLFGATYGSYKSLDVALTCRDAVVLDVTDGVYEIPKLYALKFKQLDEVGVIDAE